jgi:hypothetical protein
MEDKMKIALVCAHPDLSNSGMLSVDLAFESLKKYFNSEIEITRFCSWKDIERPGVISMSYKKLEDISQLEQFDKIIYWGDFLHWCKYGPSFMSGKGTSWYAEQHNISIDNAKKHLTDKWYSMYLLENRTDLQKKSIVFGGTVYGLSSDQIRDHRYKTALSSLYQNSRLVLMRDVLSAFYVSQLFDDRRFSYGCDCALFLDKIEDLLDEINTEPYLVYSFGRCNYTQELETFACSLAEKAGIKTVKLQWLHPKTNVTEFAKNLQIIRNAKYVVTDIYHLAINSWRENTPTLTIGNGNAYHGQGTLGDKKKEVFNSQILAMNYYHYTDNILSLVINGSDESKNSYLNSCLTQLKNKESLEIITNTIKSQVNYARDTLVKEINSK